jgi:hypothetical protein
VKRIHPLARQREFEEVARALEETELDLARVVSCTFPGRPEPRSAEWTRPNGQRVLRYEYLPDIELRYLHILSPDFSLYADGGPDSDAFTKFFVARLGESPFDNWERLREALMNGEHTAAIRAAAAFRVAVEARDDSVDGEAELVEAIATADGRGPEAAAAELVAVVTDRFGERLEQLYEAAERVEVRMHLKRALDRLKSRPIR